MKNKVLFYVFLSLASIVAFLKCYEYASLFRVNNVAGGELGLLLVPFIVGMAIKNYRDYRKAGESNAECNE